MYFLHRFNISKVIQFFRYAKHFINFYKNLFYLCFYVTN